jgi:hypothetical protein
LNKQDWRQLALGANDVMQDLRDAGEVLGSVMAKHVLPKKTIKAPPVCQHSSQLRVEENLNVAMKLADASDKLFRV